MSTWAYEREITASREHKEQSLANPDGVIYMDHLWDMVEHKDQMPFVLRTDEADFDDIAIRAFWAHGHYDWQSKEDSEHSSLIFEVADEASRRIQSNHAQFAIQRFFGSIEPVKLEHPFLGNDSDETRTTEKEFGEETENETIINDWDKLRSAIKLTSEDGGGYLGGQMITTVSTAGEYPGLARINDDRLELYISANGVKAIKRLWSQAFKLEVLQSKQ